MPNELDNLDQELQEALGDTPPEALIEFGQQMGGATAQEALSKLHPTSPKIMADPGPFSGPLVTGDELETLRQMQHGQRSGSEPRFKPPRPLTNALEADFWWFPLDEYETHPLVDSFRDLKGRHLRIEGPTARPHEVGLATFISAIGQACEMTPDWVDVLVFSTPPRDRAKPVRQGWPKPVHIVDTDRFTDRSLQVVSYTIVTTKREPDGRPEIPDWLEALRTRKQCPTVKL